MVPAPRWLALTEWPKARAAGAPGWPAALAGPWAVRPAVDIRHGIVRKQRERAWIDVWCKLPTFKFAFEVRTSHRAMLYGARASASMYRDAAVTYR